jgi:tetratricopeptide (TPR) repeat protein
MKNACQEFRSLLELVLERGSRGAPKKMGKMGEMALPELAWHEHLIACGECRALLEAEEALEILLATLPEPKLPPDLAQRVVSRLRNARQAEVRLDALLELDTSARAPAHLARSVLAGLASARERGAPLTHEGEHAEKHEAAEAALDRLLDLDRRVEVPRELARNVLASLLAARGLDPVRPRSPHAITRARAVGDGAGAARIDSAQIARDFASDPRDGAPARRFFALRSAWPYAAAAGILAAFLGWVAWQRAQSATQRASESVAESRASRSSADAPPDADMLAALDVLEHWEILKSEDVDVLLSSSIGPVDEVLLEFQDAEPAAPPPSEKEPEPPPRPPSKG